MPVVFAYAKPDATITFWDGEKAVQRPMTEALDDLLPVLPEKIMENLDNLELDPDTPIEGIMCLPEVFPARAVNAPDLWLWIQFSESPPSEKRQKRIREWFRVLMSDWFTERGYVQPGYYFVDISWGPTRGFGYVGIENRITW